MKKLLHWLDANLLTLITGFLIVAIPLYPKLPLADLIEGYIVRLRAEDIFVAFSILIYFIQLARGKTKLPRHRLAKLMGWYIVIGFLSSLSAIFITHTVPAERQHIFKLFLHFARRVEYFSLFFIAYSGVRSKKDLKTLLIVATLTLVGTLLYGLGQKYLYWPAFSTMNREFSKGMRLYLGPTSRVMSTFAGHYDFATYLMIALLLLVPPFWLSKKKLIKLALGILMFLSYWLLILTASRTSWLGYIFGITTIAALLIRRLGFWSSFRRWFTLIFISIIIMFTFGDLSTRFLQLLNSPQTIARFLPVDTGQIEPYLLKLKDFGYQLDDIKRSGLSAFKKNPPPGAVADTELAAVATPSDIPPKPVKPTELPPDVSQEEDDLRQKIASESGLATMSATTGGYSENALKYGLSIGIRLDALWPRAIEGFMRNPLLGSGYSTLVKSENAEFTQAESTDNDYLRMLGETGLLGTILFLALPLTLLSLSLKELKNKSSSANIAFLLGIIGVVIGMFINATYIDVFESSKVAYTFWLLSALAIRHLEIEQTA